ncbi:MAG: hypothetical protein J3R72DRAFT_449925 [Linnemannia gamsii]|nr:MAG: hypothetical protein J3R72DRAFT_449925 [Linnemannia gamsii]
MSIILGVLSSSISPHSGSCPLPLFFVIVFRMKKKYEKIGPDIFLISTYQFSLIFLSLCLLCLRVSV